MTFPFRPPTVGALVKAIAGYSHAGIGTLMLDAAADQWDPGDEVSKEKRLQQTFTAMRAADTPEAETAALTLATRALRDGRPGPGLHSGTIWFEPLKTALAADGWEYDEESQQLVSAIPGVVVAAETSGLEDELRARSWTTAAGHYRQALDAFGAGRWASANSQLRALLEELLPALAEAVSGVRPKEVQAAIDALDKRKLLVEG